MKIYQADDFATLYKESLTSLFNKPEYETSPRGIKIKEDTNVSLILNNPLSCLYSNEHRSSQKRYISAELLWYFMGRNDVDFIKKYAKFWESIQNPDGTVNSSYGNLLFTKKNIHGYSQYQWAYESLVKDRDSRQAVLHFNLPEHQQFSNKDFVCTLYGIFQIRNNKLNFTVHMRSNDVVWGLPTDISFFAILQSQMLSHLQITYPDLELGTYTHFVNSFHVYEHHFEIIEKMINSEFIPEEIPNLHLNFIDTAGKPSYSLSNFFNSFENNKTVEQFDPLLNWINLNIRK
jgi:thymidylate synthase